MNGDFAHDFHTILDSFVGTRWHVMTCIHGAFRLVEPLIKGAFQHLNSNTVVWRPYLCSPVSSSLSEMIMWKQEYLLRGQLFVTTKADLISTFGRTMNETINPDCLFDVDRQK